MPILENTNPEDFFSAGTRDFPSPEQLEKRYIGLILEKMGGRKDKAAQILCINRRTLYRKEREYGFVAADTPKNESELENELDHELKVAKLRD